MKSSLLAALLAEAHQEAEGAAANLARLRRKLTEAQALAPEHQARFAALRLDACAQQLAAQQLELGVLRLAARATKETQQGQQGGDA